MGTHLKAFAVAFLASLSIFWLIFSAPKDVYSQTSNCNSGHPENCTPTPSPTPTPTPSPSPSPSGGTPKLQPINFCHDTKAQGNPWVGIQTDDSGWLNGHVGDFLYGNGPLDQNGKPDHSENKDGVWCLTQATALTSPSPSPDPGSSPTPPSSSTPTPNPGEGTPTPTITPTATATPLSCPSDQHIDLTGTKCLSFELGGAPTSGGGSQVLGAATTGLVLGASTMAPTGSFLNLFGNETSFQKITDQISFPVAKEAATPARIIISDLGINLPIESGSITNGLWTISDAGASHLENSVNPGEDGNIILYGHNLKTIFGSLPFIWVGDKIQIVTSDGQTHNYIATQKETVNPDNLTDLLPTDQETLTIFTCNGLLDSTRFVVQAKPI